MILNTDLNLIKKILVLILRTRISQLSIWYFLKVQYIAILEKRLSKVKTNYILWKLKILIQLIFKVPKIEDLNYDYEGLVNAQK